MRSNENIICSSRETKQCGKCDRAIADGHETFVIVSSPWKSFFACGQKNKETAAALCGHSPTLIPIAEHR